MSDTEDNVRETFCFISGYCTPKEEISGEENEIFEEDEYKDVLMYEQDPSLQCYQQDNYIKQENESEDIPVEPKDEGLQCSFCNNSIVRYYYVCLQCDNYRLCNICESREVHVFHYSLRVPMIQPYTEIQAILELLRTHLFSKQIVGNESDSKILFEKNGDDFLLKPNSDQLLQRTNGDDSLLNTNVDVLQQKPVEDDFILNHNDNNFKLESSTDDFLLKLHDDSNEDTHSSDERSSNNQAQNEADHTNLSKNNTSIRIKKPLNAFMLYMKDTRRAVLAECSHKETAIVNQILGKRWHSLTSEERAKYYDMAFQERMRHRELYPNWSATQKIRIRTTKKKKLFLKCRAKYGIDQRHLWCQPCLRKKKCQQNILGSTAAFRRASYSSQSSVSKSLDYNSIFMRWLQ